MSSGDRRGVTLVELLLVLVLLGLLAGVSAGSLTAFREVPDPVAAALQRARVQAVRRGRPVLLRTDSTWVRFLPDGQVLRGGRMPKGEDRDAH